MKRRPLPRAAARPAPQPRPASLLDVVVHAAWSKKARSIVALDVRKLVYYTDTVMICSGTSDRHVRAVADAVADAARAAGSAPLTAEGLAWGRWVLLDLGEIVVHVFYEEVREIYELERLWADAPRIPLALAAGETPVDDDDGP